MRRFKIVVSGKGAWHAPLGRLGSIVAAVGVGLVAICLVAVALVVGYLIAGLVLAVLFLAILLAMVRSAFRALRR